MKQADIAAGLAVAGAPESATVQERREIVLVEQVVRPFPRRSKTLVTDGQIMPISDNRDAFHDGRPSKSSLGMGAHEGV